MTLRGWRRAWDRITIYLPVILMGILALGTYWLARTTPGAPQEPGARPVRHDADYFLRNFSIKSFTGAGRLKSELQGTEARHYPDTDTLEIDNPRVRSYNEQGALTVATARHAISNADGSEVQLIGDAVVTREVPAAKDQPRLELRGEFLDIYGNDEKVKSDRPVVMIRGNDRFTGDSMNYDNLDRVLQLRGNVRGVLRPGAGAAK
ncbi:MAG: LPS export ABC transporter periplasmic protein LptC [Burkholderiales bacterium]|nr:LPS export ABC transporter periplasmic protein LptC [Burkholderiales bacterium]